MHRTSASRGVCAIVIQKPSLEPDLHTCSGERPPSWASVPVDVPSSHPLGCSRKEANEEESHPCLDSFGESSCQKAERLNSAKATGTGLRAGPGAQVTSVIEQVPREGGLGMVSDSRSQVLGLFSQRLRSLRPRDQSSLPAWTV